MLKLQNITKDYFVADTTVHALRGVDLTFRKNEFVSVLGPSGCGKTTLLNIIGGLDHYTDGGLYINGVSTKNYGDRDWDNYRNHSIGFVFQSYNLIPHQTISENVELALSISGVDKEERIRRAHEALDKVGLEGQYNKKPNQLSGGQCQRVAIARAIVNEPEILLADEPTGALDTETSVQIMDIIKEIANDRLVIMVTHNPDIAEKYSTRIIRLIDGNVVGDSNPYEYGSDEFSSKQTVEETSVQEAENTKSAKRKKEKKSKLSLWGAFKLSARNLLSKLKRTLLVCIAGSIGIIGVASVLAVSSGVKGYIRSMQDDMLSGNPITISQETINMDAISNAMNNVMLSQALKPNVKDGYVNVDKIVEYLVARGKDMASMFTSNDITAEYVAYLDAMPKENYSAMVKSFGVNLSNNLYTDFSMYNENGSLESRKLSLTSVNSMYSKMLQYTPEYRQYSAYISMFTESFRIAPDNTDYILSQYDILGEGKIATESNEIMIVVDDKTSVTDLLLAQFGYYTQQEFMNLVADAVNEDDAPANYREEFSYNELLGKTFTWYPNDTVFIKNVNERDGKTYFTYNYEVDENWNTGKDLKITAILRPKDTISYGCLRSGFYYTDKLMAEVLTNSGNSQIVSFLKENNKSGFSVKFSADMSMVEIMQKMTEAVSYSYNFTMEDATSKNGFRKYTEIGFLGSTDTMATMMSAMNFGNSTMEYTLSLNNLGGATIPTRIYIYPLSFDDKDVVTDYLKEWNSDKTLYVEGYGYIDSESRSDITHTDNLEIVINLINQFIEIVTIALVAFTALSLVVSTVMISIITYVSVIERVKEIGVIRSLGGRKKDVSHLFNAETFIIGGISGLIGILITYGIQLIINLAIGITIAALPVLTALIMIVISIALTLVSGLIPASIAAKKDPVESLRSE